MSQRGRSHAIIAKALVALLGVTLIFVPLANAGWKPVLVGPTPGKTTATGVVEWGVGPDDRIYRWNGSGWDEPNPIARLKQISLGKRYHCLWGVGEDHRVYRWNGSSRDEPNPNAGLFQISCMTGLEAWAVGDANRVFHTTDGGSSWYEDLRVSLIEIAAEQWDDVWGVTATNHVMRFDGTDWNEPNVGATLYYVDAAATYVAWGTGSLGRILFNVNQGLSWIELPSPGLAQISGIDDVAAWGVGLDGHVYSTGNRATNWDEPNSAARLKQVVMGFE
jgi:Tectonin domain